MTARVGPKGSPAVPAPIVSPPPAAEQKAELRPTRDASGVDEAKPKAKVALATPGPRPHEHLAAPAFELGTQTPQQPPLPEFKFVDAGFKRVPQATLDAGGPALPPKLAAGARDLATDMTTLLTGMWMLAPATPAQGRVATYLADVKARLNAEGLPTSAPNAKIGILYDAVFDELSSHGASIARAIAGPHGLAQGADVRFATDRYDLNAPTAELDNAWFSALEKPQHYTLESLAKTSIAALFSTIHATAENVQKAHNVLPPATDGRARLFVNISKGMSVESMTMLMARGISNARVSPDSVLGRDLAARAGSNRAWSDEEVTSALRKDIKRELAAQAPMIEKMRDHLGLAVSQLRSAGGLVFASGGNNNALATDPKDALNLNAVPGMIVVGAADVKDPRDPKSVRMADFSAGDRSYTTFATVGVDLPIGENGKLETGTSFAAPVGASIAALMSEANPKLTPDDIEKILTDPRVAHDIAGTERDGAGFVDPVGAVRLARDWPTQA